MLQHLNGTAVQSWLSSPLPSRTHCMPRKACHGSSIHTVSCGLQKQTCRAGRAVTLLARAGHKQRGLTFRVAFLSSDSLYFWEKARQPTERATVSAVSPRKQCRAGRAARCFPARATNHEDSPSRWPFPCRTLGISGKKRASQQREPRSARSPQENNAALAVLSRCLPARVTNSEDSPSEWPFPGGGMVSLI
jgi:hypothetical protein